MAKKLWGGRFKKEMHPVLKKFSYSLLTDQELFFAELDVDRAYAKMLAKIKLITGQESKKILKGLDRIQKEWNPEKVHALAAHYEDIHSYIQLELEKTAGTAAKKIHTGRSRNDLVITSTRVYLREKTVFLIKQIRGVQKALVSLAEKADDLMIPGMTHLKKAQPVLMAHHLLAYVEMLEEDRSRLQDALKRINVLGLGSAALAGSSLPLDQKFLAKELGFQALTANSMAATSDRGFMAELLSALAILWMHFSRLAEDFILWNSEPFQLVELDDAFATGSSLMPQKKNPDVFELIRARSAVVAGELSALLGIQKGLPLCYNRDLQEDKPGLFDAVRKTELVLELLPLVLKTAVFRSDSAALLLLDDTLFATDLLEYLVRKGVPFSEGHSAVGRLISFALKIKKPLRAIPLKNYQQFSSSFEKDVFSLFSPEASVRAKKTLGSTNPGAVRSRLKQWKRG